MRPENKTKKKQIWWLFTNKRKYNNGSFSWELMEQMKSLANTLKYVVIVVATFPLMCIYPFVQKYFIKGVMIGSVKG